MCTDAFLLKAIRLHIIRSSEKNLSLAVCGLYKPFNAKLS